MRKTFYNSSLFEYNMNQHFYNNYKKATAVRYSERYFTVILKNVNDAAKEKLQIQLTMLRRFTMSDIFHTVIWYWTLISTFKWCEWGGGTDLQRHHSTKPRPQYGSRQMATSLDGYSSHCSFTERQKAPTALWDIWREVGRRERHDITHTETN